MKLMMTKWNWWWINKIEWCMDENDDNEVMDEQSDR